MHRLNMLLPKNYMYLYVNFQYYQHIFLFIFLFLMTLSLLHIFIALVICQLCVILVFFLIQMLSFIKYDHDRVD